ncbi:MAG TPA: Holliday junction resolvase RuvX [Tepidisphaeraceae bacterium]|jgi:putative Holliday junction resolvase|nr:Holliday junction resolvase RuvX [Tepidisphaeraceae bacterium]
MRYLAIDLGAQRTGLAISDAGGSLAAPLEVLACPSRQELIKQIATIARRQGADALIIGLPLNMNGTLGPAARAAITFGQSLAAELGNLPVHFVDERLSSFAADARLGEHRRAGQKLTRQQKKRRQDAHAAAAFLQEFLDGSLKGICV